MSHFLFRIRPLSLEKGFELTCDGILPEPEYHHRLYDAVIRSFDVGLDLDAEVKILDCEGRVADTIALAGNHGRIVVTAHPQMAQFRRHKPGKSKPALLNPEALKT